MNEHFSNGDGNLYALEQHLSGEEQLERDYEALMVELNESLGEELNELYERFKAISSGNGFEYGYKEFVTFVEDM